MQTGYNDDKKDGRRQVRLVLNGRQMIHVVVPHRQTSM